MLGKRNNYTLTLMSVVFQLINCMLKNKTKIPKEKKTNLPQESVQFLQSEEKEKEQKEILHFSSYCTAVCFLCTNH